MFDVRWIASVAGSLVRSFVSSLVRSFVNGSFRCIVGTDACKRRRVMWEVEWNGGKGKRGNAGSG